MSTRVLGVDGAMHKAPAFALQDFISGQEYTLDSFKGKKVLLTFFRFAACPMCNYRLAQMKRRAKMLQDAGLIIVCVFEATHKQMTDYVSKSNVPFPILMDPDSIAYSAYGVRHSFNEAFLHLLKQTCVDCSTCPAFCYHGNCSSQHCSHRNMSRRPADFLIDEDGSVVASHRGNALNSHIPWESVNAFVGLSSATPMGAPVVDEMTR